MRRGWVAALLLSAALAVVARPGAAQGSDLCARFGQVEEAGTIAEPRITELSGLAASGRHPGVLWGHNDSGGEPELYAMAEDGTSLGTYALDGAQAFDWEDVASGPGPEGGDFLYVGDIGDNGAVRDEVRLFVVPEPDAAPAPPGARLSGVREVRLRYLTGPADAEALLVDPRTGDLVVVTKSLTGASRVLFTLAADLAAEDRVLMSVAGPLRVPMPDDVGGGLPGTMVTGGDVSPDGSMVLLRTYRSILAFERGADQTLAEALRGEPCFAPQAEEQQGEAVAFTADGSAYVTASEGTNPTIHRVEIAATPSGAPTTAGESAPLGEPDDGLSRATLLLLLGAGLVAVGVVAVVWSRGRRGASAG